MSVYGKMGKGVSCLGIGKRKVRGGLSVKERREERGEEVGHSGVRES